MDFLPIEKNVSLVQKMQKFNICVSGITSYDEKGNITSFYIKGDSENFDTESSRFYIEYNGTTVASFSVQWLDGSYQFGYPLSPKGKIIEPKAKQLGAIDQVFTWLQAISNTAAIPCTNGVPFVLLALMVTDRKVTTKLDGFSLSTLETFDWEKAKNKIRKLYQFPSTDANILYQLTGIDNDSTVTVEATEV